LEGHRTKEICNVGVYARLGQPETSRKHREEYAKLKTQDLAETGHLRASLRHVDFANVRPLAGKCYLNAGKVYALHGKIQEAEQHWIRAVALDPQNPEPRTLLAVLYSEQGRREEAIRVQRGGGLSRPHPEGL